MADEPRRSGRATKGQHTNKASSSPAPAPKPTKSAKSKPSKKSTEPEQKDEDSDEDKIRCICGNDDPNDKRAFIGCDDCEVWQHNICMGIPEDDDDVPNSYLCEQCGPEDHQETLQAMARGERIWEVRNKIYQNEKKMSKNRKGKQSQPGWLKKDVPSEGEEEGSLETGSKRKRSEGASGEAGQGVKAEDGEDEKPSRLSSRQDKRRKSAAPVDPETEIVALDKLPSDRQKIVTALSKVLADDITVRAKAGAYRIPDGQTAKSMGEYYALRIEYAMKMNHGDSKTEEYKTQFRALNANLKKNKLLIERLLKRNVTPDELSTMSSSDMASEELQKERAAMKEQLDRQAVAIQPEGPKYRRTHKGDELIEDENAAMGQGGAAAAQPVRERTSVGDAEMGDAGSPSRMDGAASPRNESHAPPLSANTRSESGSGFHERRQSSQQFDMNNIWAKTAQSPTMAPRPMQMPPRRRSSIPQQQQQDGTKVDADVDRMLQDDDDETYSPAEYNDPDAIVWRGKLVQSADAVAPTVNAKFVAGRDITPTVTWEKLLPAALQIDGRLSIEKAEEYLCSLQYSTTSDVSVLAFRPDDDSVEGFETFFNYFRSRQRYAVVKDDKPAMVKDLYIIPFEAGEALPSHVNLMEYNAFEQKPPTEKLLLATFVVGRAPDKAAVAGDASEAAAYAGQQQEGAPTGLNGQQGLPQHMRSATQGPSGSPLNTNNPTFSPTNNLPGAQQPMTAYNSGIPPNPYTPTPPNAANAYDAPQPYQAQQYPAAPPADQQGFPSQAQINLVNEILGPLVACRTAQAVVNADPEITRHKLEHLRKLLEDYPACREDLQMLAQMLGSGG